MSDTPFTPDYAVPPGQTLDNLRQRRGWSLYQTAILLRIDEPFLRRLITGEEPLTNNMAVSLSFVLGGSIRFWKSREEAYRNDLKRLSASSDQG